MRDENQTIIQERGKIMRKAHYTIYVPGGNSTALVDGTDFSKEEMIVINDKIMEANHRHQEVPIEQVGFLGKDETELVMAGGEFCGNATRSAAFYYLGGQEGSVEIRLNRKDKVNAGVYANKEAWCEIPLYHGEDTVTELDAAGIHLVKMQGMVTVVIQSHVAAIYLQEKEHLKENATDFIRDYDLSDNEAVGVMFLEQNEGRIKINPVVWVKSIDTHFYETACGSGTVATAIVESYLTGEAQNISIEQPSGHEIHAEITLKEGNVSKALISGVVLTDHENHKVEI